MVWKNKDPNLDSILKKLAEGDNNNNKRKKEVNIKVNGKLGEPLEIIISLQNNSNNDNNNKNNEIFAVGYTSSVLVEALKTPIVVVDIVDAIGQLGDSPFVVVVDGIDCSGLQSGLFVPKGEIKVTK